MIAPYPSIKYVSVSFHLAELIPDSFHECLRNYLTNLVERCVWKRNDDLGFQRMQQLAKWPSFIKRYIPECPKQDATLSGKCRSSFMCFCGIIERANHSLLYCVAINKVWNYYNHFVNKMVRISQDSADMLPSNGLFLFFRVQGFFRLKNQPTDLHPKSQSQEIYLRQTDSRTDLLIDTKPLVCSFQNK